MESFNYKFSIISKSASTFLVDCNDDNTLVTEVLSTPAANTTKEMRKTSATEYIEM